MEYNVVDTEDVQVINLSTVDKMLPDLNIRAIDETLECQNIATKIWYFDKGEEIK